MYYAQHRELYNKKQTYLKPTTMLTHKNQGIWQYQYLNCLKILQQMTCKSNNNQNDTEAIKTN